MTVDAHTHNLQSTDGLVAVGVHGFHPLPGRAYAVGIHPWDTGRVTAADLALLDCVAAHRQVAAIGETGMDSLRGAALDCQAEVMAHHLRLALRLEKPVVIHCVRAWQQMLELCRELGGGVPCAIHGMRGNEHVARPLLQAGFYLSFGPRFNPVTVAATPPDRLLIETDDAAIGIDEVAQAVAQVRGVSAAELTALAAENLRRFLSEEHR